MATINIPREDTQERIAKALEDHTLLLSAIAHGEEGAIPQTWAGWQAVTRMGLAPKIVAPGDQFSVDRVKETTASYSGSGISGVSVDKIKFINGRGEARPGSYGFEHDGAGWREAGKLVNLDAMGVKVSGSAKKGDLVVVNESTTETILDVAGLDYDIPSAPDLTHSISLLAKNCVGNCAFDQPELVWTCKKEDYPSGLPAGTYHITLSHGAYGGGTGQDGDYQFTTKQTIPVGGGIRHTTMGQYESGGYTSGKITAGTFSTYNAEHAQIESGLLCSSGSAGTSLGTASARDLQYVKGACWLTERQRYGNNDWITSAIRQQLNSDLPSGWYKQTHAFDMPQTSPAEGFLYGLDPAFVKILGKVKKHTYHFPINSEENFVDTDELVFLASMSEVGFGANSGVWETPVVNGLPIQKPYPLFEGATNADRIKYLLGSAKYWWLRGASPINAGVVRYVLPGGSLNFSYAYFTDGLLPGLNII